MSDFNTVKKKLEDINAEDFGFAVIQATNESDNSYYEVGREVINLLLDAKTSAEFQLVSDTVLAITGYSIETFIEDIENGTYGG